RTTVAYPASKIPAFAFESLQEKHVELSFFVRECGELRIRDVCTTLIDDGAIDSAPIGALDQVYAANANQSFACPLVEISVTLRAGTTIFAYQQQLTTEESAHNLASLHAS